MNAACLQASGAPLCIEQADSHQVSLRVDHVRDCVPFWCPDLKRR
jgi:hypothetical protein